MTIDNQVGLDGQNMVAPIDGTIGGGALGNGNGLSESTPQFGSGQPLTNPSMPGAYLKDDAPVVPPGNTDSTIMDRWTQSDFLCKGWILSRLIDPLYNVYCEAKTSKQLWLALEKKYKSEDAGCQKYATAKFLNFKMVDSKPIMEQVEALQLITHEIAAEGMSICEIFTVNSFIEKLPPGWMDFKNYLTHKPGPSEDKGKSQAHLTEDDLCAVVTEVNNVEDNPREWWYDTGATIHICNDRDMFSTYQKCNNGERLLMGNTGSSKIEGHGKVVLKMTSGKEITLQNLISGTLMSKAGFATNFESDKLVLKKHGVYLGKGYVKDGLVKMCVMPVIRN
ncbi:unnamed protein product [Microthlaspi erraticum]|uniref:Retrovirus-related Pol polyprotein from transposon TNT 1-94-like beta-barrel domain-containing protein n=1 Tax=Microthlaspi erraticum TaxID=1685480 RepID=A0A6D2L812_9BRAS|nr:unnamed protein product [Microthlaspi erraticum]